MLPPRRVEDISLLTLTNDEDNLLNKLNYVVIKDGVPTKLVYFRFKTDKTYGKHEVMIPANLKNVLTKYINARELKSGDPLFGTRRNTYYKNFSGNVSDAFSKYTKKKLTANVLRHSFISDFLRTKRSTAQKRKIALDMGHSTATQAAYDRIYED